MSAIDSFLEQARSGLDRVTPLVARKLQEEGALLVDIRPHLNRQAEGEIPGAVVVERIHLEWRLAPSVRRGLWVAGCLPLAVSWSLKLTVLPN